MHSGLISGRAQRCSWVSANFRAQRNTTLSPRRVQCFCDVPVEKTKKRDIKSTIGNIDSLLGIEEEVKKEDVSIDSTSTKDITISAEALDKLRQLQESSSLAALEKAAQQESKNGTKEFIAKADLDKATGKDTDVAREVLGLLSDSGNVTASVVSTIKTDILGYSSFLIREVEYLDGLNLGGVELRGNARKEPKAVAKLLRTELEKRYADKFVVYIMPDETDLEAQEDGKERFVLQVLPKAVGQPAPTQGWQVFTAVVLLLLTVTSTASLAALVTVPKLPLETLAWLAASESGSNPAPSTIPGLDASFNALPFLGIFADTFLGVSAINSAHEFGHRIMATVNKVRLGPSLNIPNGSLGSFGAVTPAESAYDDRKQLFDVAAGGPVLGLLVASIIFFYGLQASADPNTNPDSLLPVPTFLFQGSILLGSICEATLGQAISGKQLVHPLLIAGWCGLFTQVACSAVLMSGGVQAFNLLPVGALDGGRMVRAAYGPVAHRLTSILVYIGLALGFIGGPLALPFGLFVLLAQRDPERYVMDQVTPTDSTREYTAAVLAILGILMLIPFSPDAPELIDSFQFTLQSSILQGGVDL